MSVTSQRHTCTMDSQSITSSSEPRAKRPLETDDAVPAASSTTEEPKRKRKKKKVKAAEDSEAAKAARAAFEAKWYADQVNYPGAAPSAILSNTTDTHTTSSTKSPESSAGKSQTSHIGSTTPPPSKSTTPACSTRTSGTTAAPAESTPAAAGVATAGSGIATDAVTSETPAANTAETANDPTPAVTQPAEPIDILDTIPRYDPKIHGNYDETQPYAERYRILREREDAAKQYGVTLFSDGITRDQQNAAVASFNLHEGVLKAEARVPQQDDATTVAYFNRVTAQCVLRCRGRRVLEQRSVPEGRASQNPILQGGNQAVQAQEGGKEAQEAHGLGSVMSRNQVQPWGWNDFFDSGGAEDMDDGSSTFLMNLILGIRP
ncbi:hypothetical protein AMS68_008036 [Peltaster fructicola]|uniref:Uncharacterized protein n=1 Tax=Peltaster fructicola TaxID=286661 RepID=A0A6H0Y6R7_9PEZI|nr:hypothetical protein AMS68_008036 [Peltaster fructicola]